MKADSIEATFVEQTVRALGRNLFHPYLGETVPNYPLEEVFLERVLRERPAMWMPAEFHNYDDFIIASADLAVAELTTSTGRSDPFPPGSGESETNFLWRTRSGKQEFLRAC